jgi:hypothetical protein
MASLYLPRFARPRAGLAASLGGFAVALGFFVAVHAFGSFDDEWGTQIWVVVVRGTEVQLWQEYAVLAALPVSALAFVIGSASGGPASPPKMHGPATVSALEPPAHGNLP